MKLRTLRHPSTAAKHIKLEAAAQFSPLSEWDLEDIDYLSALTSGTSTNDFAAESRRLRQEFLNDEV